MDITGSATIDYRTTGTSKTSTLGATVTDYAPKSILPFSTSCAPSVSGLPTNPITIPMYFKGLKKI